LIDRPDVHTSVEHPQSVQIDGSRAVSFRERLQPLARRSTPHEILDDGNHQHEELFGTFRDMARVNRLLGGVALTCRGIARLTGEFSDGDDLEILDVGAGHADIPRSAIAWARSRGVAASALALELDLETIATARQVPENGSIRFIQGDMTRLPLGDGSVDIAISSMTFHHLSDSGAVAALREMARVSRLGIVVNDLLRTTHGYVVAWLLGRVATNNRLTRHDAHRSIQRGRTVRELAGIARDAGLQTPVFDTWMGYRAAMTIGVRPWR
jgi:ubiquinone/menaquinone biosynthesis C-methylase UbiE